jgi:hypothetical protein
VPSIFNGPNPRIFPEDRLCVLGNAEDQLSILSSVPYSTQHLGTEEELLTRANLNISPASRSQPIKPAYSSTSKQYPQTRRFSMKHKSSTATLVIIRANRNLTSAWRGAEAKTLELPRGPLFPTQIPTNKLWMPTDHDLKINSSAF